MFLHKGGNHNFPLNSFPPKFKADFPFRKERKRPFKGIAQLKKLREIGERSMGRGGGRHEKTIIDKIVLAV